MCSGSCYGKSRGVNDRPHINSGMELRSAIWPKNAHRLACMSACAAAAVASARASYMNWRHIWCTCIS